MKNYCQRYVLSVAISAIAVTLAQRVRGDEFMYSFVHVFSGGAPASPTNPWMNAVFQDLTPGTVRLTVSNLTLSGAENVDELYLNLRTNLSPTSLKFTSAGGSGGFENPKVATGVNLFKADGDGKYDMIFSFNSSGSKKKQFNGGEYMVYDISGIAGLTAADFQYLSAPAGGVGPFLAAVHVQRIAGGISGWIAPNEVTPMLPVPEPSSQILIAVLAGMLVAYHIRRRTVVASARVRLQPVPVLKRARRN